MQFKKLDTPPIRAENVSATGALYYAHWADQHDNDYIQIVENVGGRGASVGSFSSDLYRVDDLGGASPPSGYDPKTGDKKTTSNRNMPAFLRAINLDIKQRYEQSFKSDN